MPKLSFSSSIASRTRSRLYRNCCGRFQMESRRPWEWSACTSKELDPGKVPSGNSVLDEGIDEGIVTGQPNADELEPNNLCTTATKNVSKFGTAEDMFNLSPSISKRQIDAAAHRSMKPTMLQLINIMPQAKRKSKTKLQQRRDKSSGAYVRIKAKGRGKRKAVSKSRTKAEVSKQPKKSKKLSTQKSLRRIKGKSGTAAKHRRSAVKKHQTLKKQKASRLSQRKTANKKNKQRKVQTGRQKRNNQRASSSRKSQRMSHRSRIYGKNVPSARHSISEEKHMSFNPPNTILPKSVDQNRDHDEDPLCVNKLCRSLVKSLHCVPADIREKVKDPNDPYVTQSRKKRNICMKEKSRKISRFDGRKTYYRSNSDSISRVMKFTPKRERQSHIPPSIRKKADRQNTLIKAANRTVNKMSRKVRARSAKKKQAISKQRARKNPSKSKSKEKLQSKRRLLCKNKKRGSRNYGR